LFLSRTQVGLSYGLPQVTSHRVCRLRNFMRWCCLFVLAVWLTVSLVLANELHFERQSLQPESLRVLRVVCLAAETATLLLLTAFVATFVHEFTQISAELFKVRLCVSLGNRGLLEGEEILQIFPIAVFI
jgi:RsiW-degrading membrane proteinase PrsW (M82 family)